MKKLKQLKTWFKNWKRRNDPNYQTKRPLKYKTKRQIKRVKKLALGAHEITGLQYHIMPMGENVIIIDNNWRKVYNKLKGVKKVNINGLLRMAHFSTPSGNRMLK